MTEERKNELDEMVEAGNADALKEIKDADERRYVIQQIVYEMAGGKVKDDETRNNIIKDCVAHCVTHCVAHRDVAKDIDELKGIDELKAWFDTYMDSGERSYATYVFNLLAAFSTDDVEYMAKYLEDIKLLPRKLLPEYILRRIDQLDKIKDMTAEEMSDDMRTGINMISTLIDNIKTVYDEHEIIFDIAKIAIDLHVYSDNATLIHTKITTPAIEEAYAKHNS